MSLYDLIGLIVGCLTAMFIFTVTWRAIIKVHVLSIERSERHDLEALSARIDALAASVSTQNMRAVVGRRG